MMKRYKLFDLNVFIVSVETVPKLIPKELTYLFLLSQLDVQL